MGHLFKSLVLVGLVALSYRARAQQDPMYSQYMFNSLAINPAYAGSRNVLSATALYRSQWTGVEGAPKTGTFTLDAALDDRRIGLGLLIYSDRLGITNTTGAAGSYAYRIRMSRASLSFGIQGSIQQYRANFTDVRLNNNSAYDPAFANNSNKILANFGTGVYLNSDKFYVGLSALNLLANQITSNSNSEKGNNSERSGTRPHLFLASGFVFTINDDFKLKPSMLIKGVSGAPVEADLTSTLWIKDVIALGAQYRTNADVSGLLEVQATPQVRIGYSYDHSTTELKGFNSGSHEIMVRFEFGASRNKILSPRYF